MVGPASERGPEQPARARQRGRRTPVTPVGTRIVPAGLNAPTVDQRGAQVRRALWLAAVGLVLGGLILTQVLDSDPLVRQALAATMGVLLTVALTVRSGGRPVPTGLVALALSGTAVASQWPPLLAGCAVATAVVAACLAVLGTTPAASMRWVVREVVLAQVVAAVGAVAVAGFAVDIDARRFSYVVLAASLVAMILMVYRLGAGLHGLGRRGLALGATALVILAVALAYSEALGRWGSPELTGQIDDVRFWVRDRLGAVPHPIEVLLGLPTLAWGVFMRARRRQGWWVIAFGVAATAPMTSRLIDSGVTITTTVLGAVYSLALGLLAGYLLIRAEQSFGGTHGRRARRSEEAAAHRPEPARLWPLH